jgi:hypothetical protein
MAPARIQNPESHNAFFSLGLVFLGSELFVEICFFGWTNQQPTLPSGPRLPRNHPINFY